MNKEEIDKWLDNEYGCSYTRLEELHDFLADRNIKFQDELDKYKNIVDELEKWLNKNLPIREQQDLQIVIDKLEELKGKQQ